jgi:hypothetical protein
MKKLFIITLMMLLMTSCFTKPDPVSLANKEMKLDSLINVYENKTQNINVDSTHQLKVYKTFNVPVDQDYVYTFSVEIVKNDYVIKVFK